MAFIVDSFWFWITTACQVLVRVLSAQLYRIILDDSSKRENVTPPEDTFQAMQSLTEPIRVETDEKYQEKAAQETSCIEFTFRFEIPQCRTKELVIPVISTDNKEANPTGYDTSKCTPFHQPSDAKLSPDECSLDRIGSLCNNFRYIDGKIFNHISNSTEMMKPTERERFETGREHVLDSHIVSGDTFTVLSEVGLLSEKNYGISHSHADSETLDIKEGNAENKHHAFHVDENFLSEKDFKKTTPQPEVAVNSMSFSFNQENAAWENSIQDSPVVRKQCLSAEFHGAWHSEERKPSTEEPVDISFSKKQQNEENAATIRNSKELTLNNLHDLDDPINPQLELEQDIIAKENRGQKTYRHFKEMNFKKECDIYSCKEKNEMECIWEHQELIEQLRMELRKVKVIGLPTILEESDSSQSMEELKTLKIDAQLLNEDTLDEFQISYKSYRERMRKLDILNYQKMYAIGFFQLRDIFQFFSTRKTTNTSIIHNLWPYHRKKLKTDLPEKFIKDLQKDLETVYVGQLCLSWEFLSWQYEKFQEILDTESFESKMYNHVAGEFQQLQVILQRFLENEPFEGPRIPCYAKNRCVLRKLLQVPVLQEDCFKNKVKETRVASHSVTSEQIEYIMVQSIRIFWEFIKADKTQPLADVKALGKAQAELLDSEDLERIVKLQANLRKKEKKLKDIIRVGNCLIKRLRKTQEEIITQDIFFAQVDLKLISRVLKMSGITSDQISWCHKKLGKICIEEGKLYRDFGFLPFPC